MPRETAATILERWDDCQVHTAVNPKTGRNFAARVYLMRGKGEPDLLYSTTYCYRTEAKAEEVMTKILEDLRERYPNPQRLRRG